MEDDIPKPRRRFVIGKTLFALLVAYMLVTAAARVWWGWYADRQLQAEIDMIHQRGEPVSWKEMEPPPIPDDKNAAEIYKRIVEMPEYKKAMTLKVVRTKPSDSGASDEGDLVLQDGGDGVSLFDMLQERQFRLAYPDLAKRFLAEIDKPLSQVRQARGLKSNYKLNHDCPSVAARLPACTQFLNLARALNIAALEAHRRGDDASAVEYLQDAQSLGDSMFSMEALIGHLYGISIESLNAVTIEEICSDLKIGAAPPASAEQVQALITQLLNTKPAQKSLRRVFMAERSLGFDVASVFAGDFRSLVMEVAGREKLATDADSAAVWAMKCVSGPAWKTWGMEHLQLGDTYVAQAGFTYYAPWSQPVPAYLADNLDFIHSYGHYVSRMLTPALGRVFVMHYRDLSQRRMAAVALAIRLYELERGKRPATLAELCPKYLPAVPEDPFDPGRKAIKYLPNAKHPILYCVGENARDDGGQYTVASSGKGIAAMSMDEPFFLDGLKYREEAAQGSPTSKP